MADLIENPVINSPFAEPRRHFRFTDDGIVLPARWFQGLIEQQRIPTT
jgi:hypothetical protein